MKTFVQKNISVRCTLKLNVIIMAINISPRCGSLFQVQRTGILIEKYQELDSKGAAHRNINRRIEV